MGRVRGNEFGLVTFPLVCVLLSGGRPAVTIHCHSEVGLPLARITVVARSFVATILGPQDYAHG